jgi:hypothetical protein
MSDNGLPSLPDNVAVFSDVVLLVGDALGLFGYSIPQWGIFLDGQAVVLADNVISFEYSASSRISKYPQEQGAFASYNKVTVPAEPRFRFSTGGSLANRQAFLESIAAIAGDLNLYDVVTPEAVYTGFNVIRQGYPRTSEDANLISVDVYMEEVVIAGSSSFTNTTSPTDQAQLNNGLVQPQPYTGPNLGSLQPSQGTP